MSKGDSVSSLAKEFKIHPASLLNANRAKRFVRGEWVFIPLPRGLFANKNVIYVGEGNYSKRDFFKSQFLWPIPKSKKISSNFGKRGNSFHQGIDVPAKMGSYILASDNGKVSFSGRKSGYGNVIIINHSKNLQTVYAHTQKRLVRNGQKVFRGQIIGTVGTTGKSTGPHLHFEVRKNQRSINPLSFLN